MKRCTQRTFSENYSSSVMLTNLIKVQSVSILSCWQIHTNYIEQTKYSIAKIDFIYPPPPVRTPGV